MTLWYSLLFFQERKIDPKEQFLERDSQICIQDNIYLLSVVVRVVEQMTSYVIVTQMIDCIVNLLERAQVSTLCASH